MTTATTRKLVGSRATTLAKALDDQSGLIKWSSCATLDGAFARDDLRARFQSLDPADKRGRYQVAEQMKEAGAASRGANLGTALHAFTERLDRGEIEVDQVPAEWRDRIAAYSDVTRAAGWRFSPQLVERITAVEVADELVAGTFDRVAMLPDGRLVIADVKTGSLDYAGLSIAVQLAVYAHGRALRPAGEEPDRDRWGRYLVPGWDDETWQPMPPVDQVEAWVIHLPATGEPSCTLHSVDIAAGWEAAQVAAAVRAWRKRGKGLVA